MITSIAVFNALADGSVLTMPPKLDVGRRPLPLPSSPGRHAKSASLVRTKSDRMSSLRKAFRSALAASTAPPHSKSPGDFAHDAYAAACRVSSGFVIPNYTLDVIQTSHLAEEVDKHLGSPLVWLIDSRASEAIVFHADNCCGHMLDRDRNFFIDARSSHPKLMTSPNVPHLAGALSKLVVLIDEALSLPLIVEVSELVNAQDAEQVMVTLVDFLLDRPVAFVGASWAHVILALANQPCWIVQVTLEGFRPKDDHAFEACHFPDSLFSYHDYDSFEIATTDKVSVQDVVGRLQNQFLDRLNESELASSVWSDVVVNTCGPLALT